MSRKICLAILAISALQWASGAMAASQHLAQELYIKSGMEKQIQQVPNLIRSGFDQALKQDKNLQQMNRAVIAAMRDIIEDAFEASKLKKTIMQAMEQDMSPEAMQAVINWLDSPLGKKCTRLEESASTVSGQQALQRFAMQLEKNPPSTQRLGQAERLDEAIGATENHVNLTMNTQLAVSSAIMATLPKEKQIPFSELKNRIEQARPQIAAAVQMNILVSFLYVYQPLTSAELDGYIDFANSREGVIYHQATIAGFKKAILEASLTLGNSIGELLVQVNQQEAM